MNLVKESNTLNKQSIKLVELRPREMELRDERDRYKALIENAPIAIWEADYSESKKFCEYLQASGVKNIKAHFNKNKADLIKCISLTKGVTTSKAALDLYEAKNQAEINAFVAKELPRNKAFLNAYTNVFCAVFNGLTSFCNEETKVTVKNNYRRVILQYFVPPGYERNFAKVFFTAVDITKRKKAEDKLKSYQGHLEDIVEERTRTIEKANKSLKAEIQRRKKTEKALESLFISEKNLRQELEQQIQQKIELTRVLAHELKTPITPILLAGEMLVRHETDEKLQNGARTIYQGALALNKRIDELLDLAKGKTGVLDINASPCDDFLAIINSVSEYMSYIFKSKNQKFSVKLPESIPCVNIDSERIRQVLINLLDNASKFTPKSGHISVKVKNLRDKLVAEISDTGLGVTRGVTDEIFEPYHSIKTERSSYSGMGVGLPLSKILINLHGGEIWFKSREGKGSTFFFSLPYYKGTK